MKLVIFGCGRIAHRIAESCLKVENLQLLGFASKDIQKARMYADRYGCKEAGNYEYFLDSEQVDSVYIATYNPSHYERIKEAILHHKNVICEKPMLSSLEENEELFALARENKVLLMEALKSVFLPIIRKTKEMLQKQEIGEIEQIYASFMRNGSHMENHWINDPRTGGALKDLGTYTIGTMNYLMGAEPVLIRKWTNGTASHSDTIAYVDLDYNGIKGRSEVSNSMDGNHTLIVYGTKGKIQIDDFWKTGKGLLISEKGELEINEELISDFYYELKHFTDLCDQHILESEIMNKEASDRILKITQ